MLDLIPVVGDGVVTLGRHVVGGRDMSNQHIAVGQGLDVHIDTFKLGTKPFGWYLYGGGLVECGEPCPVEQMWVVRLCARAWRRCVSDLVLWTHWFAGLCF